MGDLPKKLEYKQKRDKRGSPIAGKNTHGCVGVLVLYYDRGQRDKETTKKPFLTSNGGLLLKSGLERTIKCLVYGIGLK